MLSRIIIPFTAVILIAASCAPEGSGGYAPVTRLTISNATSYNLGYVKWRDTLGTWVYFGTDCWTNGTNIMNGLFPGSCVSRLVSPGSGYVYCFLNTDPYRTTNILTVTNGQSALFIFTGGTVMVPE